MENSLITCLTLCLFVIRSVAGPTDSLVINLANRTKIIIHAPDKKGIQALSAYDLNKIVKDMGVKLDSLPNGRTYVIEERNGQRYLKDTVLVITKKGNGVSIVVKRAQTTVDDSTADKATQEGKDREAYQREKSKSVNAGLKVKTDFQIGLNNWISGGSTTTYQNGMYDLRPLGSRYFAISLYRNPMLIKGKTVRLSVRYGLEVAWNNYMFEENVRATKGTTTVEFKPVVESLTKSKLTVATIQLPVVPQVSFYNTDGKKTFHLGLGGFIGYRIDSYTKIKNQNGDKNRDHSNYYLNDLQYGLVANIGLLRTDLFVKYNLNSMFKTDQGPDLRTISFGLSL